MKFLDYDKLSAITEALALREAGDKVLNGRLEAYSCKPASDDRKLAHELKSAFREELGESTEGNAGALRTGAGNGVNRIRSGSFSSTGYLSPAGSFGHSYVAASPGSSPLGNLHDAATRKLLVNLIQTMNAVFPDYDFSSIRPESFSAEQLPLVVKNVNYHLAELCDVIGPNFLEELWAAIDEVVSVDKCEVFSYVPDMDGDPFSDGNLWSFNYFFVNRREKRIVFFTCMAKSKLQSMEEDGLAEEMMTDEVSPTHAGSYYDMGDENFVVDL